MFSISLIFFFLKVKCNSPMRITFGRKIAFTGSSYIRNCLTFSLRRLLFSTLCIFCIRKAIDFLLLVYITQWINTFNFCVSVLCYYNVISSWAHHVFFLLLFGWNTHSPNNDSVVCPSLLVDGVILICFKMMLRMARGSVMMCKRTREIWLRGDFPLGLRLRKEGDWSRGGG